MGWAALQKPNAKGFQHNKNKLEYHFRYSKMYTDISLDKNLNTFGRVGFSYNLSNITLLASLHLYTIIENPDVFVNVLFNVTFPVFFIQEFLNRGTNDIVFN